MAPEITPESNNKGNPLPAALKPLMDLPNWVIWRWEVTKTGKRTKVPYQARNPRLKAEADDSSTWATYEEAVAAANTANGIGFVLTGTNIVAFDIDDCRDTETGEIHPWAEDLVVRAASYTEITISGTGLRIIGRGDGDKIHRTFKNVNDGVACELYRKAIRYIVMTGNQIGDYPLVNLDAVMDATLAELDRERPGSPGNGGHHARQSDEQIDEDLLDWTIRTGGNVPKGERSEKVWFVVNEMLRLGYLSQTIVETLLDRKNGISAHIYDQKWPEGYARKQVKDAIKKIQLSVDEHGKPYKTQDNIRLALLKMGITVRYDRFANRTPLDGQPEFGATLNDAALIRIRLVMEKRFKLPVGREALFDIISDVGQRNNFHPVCDYLDSLKWDGVKRLDNWLPTYGGAESTEYTRAVGALMLTAAVRRVRRPGCQFDEMVVLESDQGTNKSSALKILAVKDEWFSDSVALNTSGKEAIELLSGKWIIEIPELSGMRRAEIEHIKATVSRSVDRGRLAYDRAVTEKPRHNIFVGTTNNNEYLKDTTGNRRFWPVGVKRLDLDALRRDRDQLWAEAATREASGASIRLAQELWPTAAEEQKQRLTQEPFYEMLQPHLDHLDNAKISSESVWTILDMRGGQRTQDHNKRMGDAMRLLGWRRANKANLVSIEGKKVVGYVKGDGQFWPYTVEAIRDRDGLLVTVTREGDNEPPHDL